MRKYIAVPMTCALAMMALTGCTDPSTLYENNDPCCTGNDLLQSRRMVTEQPDGRRYD